MNIPSGKIALALSLLITSASLFAQTAAPGTQSATPLKLPQTELEKKGLDYLLTQQDKEGAWLPQVGPAVTAMVTRALVQSGKPLTDPAIVKALAFIETAKQSDGGYYKGSNPNYNSAIVLATFASFHNDQYKDRIASLQSFLKSLQMDETKDVSGKPLASVQGGKPIVKDNPWYGGAGYGEDRPDLSNTSYMMEALHESGIPATDPAMQKALVFVSRCQMNSETNPLEFAKGATDGGFIYTPVSGGESKFGDIDKLEGGSQLRSYGSMTYAGFKSMLYAGLTKDDPRVKAAIKWIQNNWTLDYNPGSGNSADGQFYFLLTYAKALHACGQDSITDAKGIKHDWRAELNAKLKELQKPDGSWVNEKSPRWFEGNPILATSYSVLSLQEARK